MRPNPPLSAHCDAQQTLAATRVCITDVRASLAAMRVTLIEMGAYIDPMNRERDLYLAGAIDVYELEDRLDRMLGIGSEPTP